MVRIVNVSRGTTVAVQVKVARSYWSRLVGLTGRAGLSEGEGLLLSPCSSVQCFFMRFPIDVIFVDREAQVVRVVPGLRPFRLALGGHGAWAALEAPAGTAARSGTVAGDHLMIKGDGWEEGEKS